MGLPELAAREAFELTTHTMVGRAAVEAAKHGIAEVLGNIGLKRAASAVTRSNLGVEELEYLKSQTDKIAKGQMTVPHGEVEPVGANYFSAANAFRLRMTGYAEGTRKVSEQFGSIPDRMHFPKSWVENGIYTHDRTFNIDGPSSHRLIANLSETSPGPVRYGDRVLFSPGSNIAGEYRTLYPKTEVGPTAVVKMDQNYFAEPKLNPAVLMPLKPQLWFDEAGAMYSSTVKSVDLTPPTESLKFLSEYRAVDPKDLKYLSGERPLPLDARAILQKNDELIAANASRPNSFLYALSSSPMHGFRDTPLLPWKPSSIFNPRGFTSNCMSCTAAVFRTLNSGMVTTAEDIARVVTKEGERVGEPYFGRFDHTDDAIDWFKKAAGARVVEQGPFTGEFVPGSSYALTMRANRNSGDVQHMVFGHSFKDYTAFVFDGQSGVQLKPRSVSQSNMAPYFYRLEADK